MKSLSYPNLRQSLILIFFSFLSFTGYFFLTLTLPQILGLSISKLWVDISYSLASPIATLPLIFFVSYKSGIKPLWPFKLPSFKIILLLAVLSVSVRIIMNPLINPKEFFTNIFNDKFRFVILEIKEFDVGSLISFILTVSLVPIIEEIFWRKQVLGMLLRRTSPVLAIVISSILFAVAHLQLENMGALIIWGLLFGYVFYKTNSIINSIVLHLLTILSGYFVNFKFISSSDSQFIIHIIIILICMSFIAIIFRNLNRSSSPEIYE